MWIKYYIALNAPTFFVLCGAGVATQRFEMQLGCN